MRDRVRDKTSWLALRRVFAATPIAAVIVLLTSGAAFGVSGGDSLAARAGDSGALGLDAMPTAKPRPKTPATTLAATGILRYGDSYGRATGYERYAYVIVPFYTARKAARLPGTSLLYRSGTSVYPHWSSGMTYTDALENGWLLKDAAGEYVTNARYAAFVGDVGDPAYQRRFVQTQLEFLKKSGNDGIFLDDVLATPMTLNGSFPTKYPTHEAWENAIVSFVATVGRGLRAKGYYVLANTGAWIPGDEPKRTVEQYIRFYKRIAPHVDGIMLEGWAQTLDHSQLRAAGPNWWELWDEWQSLLSVTQRAGADFFALTSGPATDVRAMRYGRASFLLDWNGRDGAYLYHMTDRADPYHSAWVKQLGRPLGKKVSRGAGIWQRPYERGIVVLNATTSSVTVTVGKMPYSIAATDARFVRAPRR